MAFILGGVAILIAMGALFMAVDASKKAEIKSSDLMDAQVQSLKQQLAKLSHTVTSMDAEQKQMANQVKDAVARSHEAVDSLIDDVQRLHQDVEQLDKTILPTARRHPSQVSD